MAMYNGEWLERDERESVINLLRKNIAIYDSLMQANALTEQDVDNFESDLDALERLERIHRGEHDFLYYMYEYFSEELNAENDDNLVPAGVQLADAPDFHKTLGGMLDEITKGHVNKHVAWSVGRNHAKTALLTNGYLSHQVAYRKKRYIVVVSETTDVAGDFITWTNHQLKHNEKLRDDFGELLDKRKVRNESDNRYEFITTTGTKVEARGTGVQMRGLRHGSIRPDLMILDDLESKSNTNTPELRAKNLHWFREEALQALDRDGRVIYMGTVVHMDSLLAYVMRERRDFQHRNFPAILQWSEREDLWDEWRKIYRQDSETAAEDAYRFYLAHQDAMLAGTQVLWASRWSYYDLMRKREDEGSKAFNQEYMNNPIDEESQIFREEDITYYSTDELPRDLRYFMGVDYASGKERGDYSSVSVVGQSTNGVYYVIESWNERVHGDILIKKVVELAMKYLPEVISAEAIFGQEFFVDHLKNSLMAQGYPAQTRVKPIKHHKSRKEIRIEAMLPDVQSGRIRFHKSQRLLLEMLTMFPMHSHDDSVDSLEMAISGSRTSQITIRQGRKRTR